MHDLAAGVGVGSESRMSPDCGDDEGWESGWL